MPFTREEFFRVFLAYNALTGTLVWLFYLLALASVFFLYRSSKNSNRFSLSVLAFMWLWMGVVYHWLFFSEINPAAKVFGGVFVIQAILLGIATFKNVPIKLSSSETPKGIFQLLCVLYALVIYPLLGVLFGHAYPKGPVFGLPCPTTIFTFGILLGTEGTRTTWIPLHFIPLTWAFIATTAAYSWGVYEDFGLIVSALGFMILHYDFQLRSKKVLRREA